MSWIEGAFYDASFGVEKCRRYHAKLRDHYQRLHDGIQLSNAIAGSGAFIAFQGSLPSVAGTLAGIVALGSLFDLYLHLGKKAQMHDALCQKFIDLAADLETWEPTEANLRKAKAKRLRIEKGEKVTKRLVDIVAHIETARSRGVPESRLPPLSKWQRSLACFCTFGLHRIDSWNRAQQA